jgi:OOP family OmpA-OmpF porin
MNLKPLNNSLGLGRLAGSLTLASALLLTATAVSADEIPARLTSVGGIVSTATGDCVQAIGGDNSPNEACGDVIPMAEPVATLEVVAAETAATATTTVMDQIAIAATMLFDFDSAELSDDAKAVIDERIQALAGQARLTSAMRIEGHTDSTGPEAYNLQLSERRAQAVADYIVSKAYRVTAEDIELVAKGESQPIASNATREGRAQNRRVDISAQGAMQP